MTVISLLRNTDDLVVLADLPDEYFVPTASDLKAAQHTLSSRTQALVNAPLQLRAAREANEKAKLDRWPAVSCTYQCSNGLKPFIADHYTGKVYGSYSTRTCLSVHGQDTVRIRFREGMFEGRR
jgi:tether containing UBX domain for GLUT4